MKGEKNQTKKLKFCKSGLQSILSSEIFLQETLGSLFTLVLNNNKDVRKRLYSQGALIWAVWNQYKPRQIPSKLYGIYIIPCRVSIARCTIHCCLVKIGPVVSVMFCVIDRDKDWLTLPFIMLVRCVSSSGVDSVSVCVCVLERKTDSRQQEASRDREKCLGKHRKKKIHCETVNLLESQTAQPGVSTLDSWACRVCDKTNVCGCLNMKPDSN